MSDQIMPPEDQDPEDLQAALDRIVSEGGPGDVVFHGVGLFRMWDLGVGPKDMRRGYPRGGFRAANY